VLSRRTFLRSILDTWASSFRPTDWRCCRMFIHSHCISLPIARVWSVALRLIVCFESDNNNVRPLVLHGTLIAIARVSPACRFKPAAAHVLVAIYRTVQVITTSARGPLVMQCSLAFRGRRTEQTNMSSSTCNCNCLFHSTLRRSSLLMEAFSRLIPPHPVCPPVGGADVISAAVTGLLVDGLIASGCIRDLGRASYNYDGVYVNYPRDYELHISTLAWLDFEN